MRYPKYAKIYLDDEGWCAKLDGDWYVSEDVVTIYKTEKDNKLQLVETESYLVQDLKEYGIKYEKITEKEYKQSIIEKTKQQIKAEIDLLYEKIEKLKKEEEYILSNI